MLNKCLLKAKRFLLNFLQIQLFITLVSLPILICWGLPISKLSFVGNLIFLPILTLFLVLSSLLFFTQIFGIPNGVFAYLLDKLVLWWQHLLDYGSNSWLVGFSRPNFLFLVLILVFVLIVLTNKYLNMFIHRRIFALLGLVCFFTFYLFYNDLSQKNITLQYGKSKLLVSRNEDGRVFLYDFSFLCRKRNLANFLEYELRPYILKKFGTINIQDLSFLHRNKRNWIIKKEFSQIFDLKTR